MKKITALVITVSSQLLVVFVFSFLLFGNVGSNKNVTVIDNNNFDKMADSTLVLFEEEKQEEVVVVEPNLFYDSAVLDTLVGTITGYGPDCFGCSGNTASGHNLHESIYYDDSEFGVVRILAADKSIPFYSIFRVSGIAGMDPFIAIVLDRGSTVGIDNCNSPQGCLTMFDLAFESETGGVIPLTRNVTFEMLRSGK